MRSLSLALFLFLSPTIAFAQATQVRKSPPEIAEINSVMQKFVDSGDISGAVTLVGHQGKIVHLGAIGLADIDSNRAMKKSSLFSIASMTKPVVSTAVMILQDEGKLSFDDKVSKYMPAFADVKLNSGESPSREITIRDCVTHTAGLSGKQIFTGSLETAVNELAKRPLAFSPGEKWQYSPGLNVAGRIVEIVAQQPLEDFLRQRIFEPLSMNHTTFFPNEKQIRRTATLYEKHEANTALTSTASFLGTYSEIEAPNPSGGLFSTAGDMFRFYQMVLNDGRLRRTRIVSSAGVGEMTSPKTGDLETGFTPGNCWGLGWCIVREPRGTTAMLSKGTFGHGGAYGTQGWVDPGTRTIYVLMIQRKGLKNSDGSEIRKTFQQVASDQLK
jgi:CubicO group peptidase (beta-lactamase class C family)